MLFSMYNEADLEIANKWSPTLEAEDVAPIEDINVKVGTARMLENALIEQERFMEATPTTVAANIANLNPAIGSIIRRVGPTLMNLNAIVGVQPLPGPNAQAFSMVPKYIDNGADAELNLNPANSAFTGRSSDGSVGWDSTSAVASDTEQDPFAAAFTYGGTHSTAQGEGDIASELSLDVVSTPVNVGTRVVKATFSEESYQDMLRQHGVNSRTLFDEMLSKQIAAETEQEIVRKLYDTAVLGCADTATPGVYDLQADTDGRWIGENARVLAMRIISEASEIFLNTRIGHGSFAIVDHRTYNVLYSAGLIENGTTTNSVFSGSSALVKSTTPGQGVLMGEITIIRDDNIRPAAGTGTVLVGYRGASPFEAAAYYCPYIPAWPLGELRDENSWQPKVAWKSRYGTLANPFAGTNGAFTNRSNPLLRVFRIDNLSF